MRPLPCLVLAFILLFPPGADAQQVRRFRQWMEGVETGGAEVISPGPAFPQRIEQRAWTQLERMGVTSRQEFHEAAVRSADGSIAFSWSVLLSSEPMTGSATWSPAEPGVLRVSPRGGTPSMLAVPPGAVLWPGDADSLLKQAAKERQPVRIREFSGTTQEWAELEAQPVGPEALPGFPDAVLFRGRRREGRMSAELDLWISPREGEVKHVARTAGLTVQLQRAELPPPSIPPTGPAFFERTLAQLPPHPFLLWLPEALLRWEGQGIQELPQDDQQTRLDANLYRVKAALAPTAGEAAERPVTGSPSPEDAPYLAATPLVQFPEPVFAGLIARMNIRPGATRWGLARQATRFVFEWISEKDLTVGFASASEVARIPRGDCTEHGVLAVALLRRLGVPARGVVGWAALGELVGVHFWVEVRLGSRWLPVDPTFDQAPASALRLKVATTDLSSLASIGWESPSLQLAGGAWVPADAWAGALKLEGGGVTAPGGVILRFPDGHWSLREGHLLLESRTTHELTAVAHPTPAQLEGAKRLLGVGSRKSGWWHPGKRILWMDLGGDHWLQVDRMDEPSAFDFLDRLDIRF